MTVPLWILGAQAALFIGAVVLILVSARQCKRLRSDSARVLNWFVSRTDDDPGEINAGPPARGHRYGVSDKNFDEEWEDELEALDFKEDVVRLSDEDIAMMEEASSRHQLTAAGRKAAVASLNTDLTRRSRP